MIEIERRKIDMTNVDIYSDILYKSIMGIGEAVDPLYIIYEKCNKGGEDIFWQSFRRAITQCIEHILHDYKRGIRFITDGRQMRAEHVAQYNVPEAMLYNNDVEHIRQLVYDLSCECAKYIRENDTTHRVTTWYLNTVGKPHADCIYTFSTILQKTEEEK